MNQYVILAGGGRVSRRTAEILGDYDYEITVIERDADRCERLADDRFGTIVHGDATDPDVLERTEPERADVFAALTGDTDTNLSLCTTIEERADGIRTVARTDRESESGDLADSVVSPEAAGAKAAADEILGRNIRSLRAATGNLDVIEVEVNREAPAAGKRLDEVLFPSGSQVVSGADGTDIAGPETELQPGRRYIVATEPSVADDVWKLMVKER